MATESDIKKLSDLRVVDLRAELEKRGLDKTGNKANLTERLQKALVSEGHNPEEYNFDMAEKKTLKRLSTSTKSDDAADKEEKDKEIIDKEDKEDREEKEEKENDEKEDKEVKTNKADNMSKSDNVEKTDKNESKDDMNDSAVTRDENDKKNEHAESPLNLSIGEEEENLLLNSGDEQDNAEKSNKTSDEKIAGSNNGATSDMAKENQPENKTSDTDGKDEAREGEQEQQQDKNNKEDKASPKNDTANDASSKAAQTSSSNAAATSDSEHKSDKSKSTKSNPGRSLWITNLLPSTRAQELKHLLSRYGKVIGAKVVQSSRYPRTRCYGYVTMETRAAADLCIEKLNNTELKGQIIRVAKVRPEHSLPLKPSSKKTESGEKHKSKSPSKQTEKISTENSTDKSGDKKKPTPVVVSSSDKKKDEKSSTGKDSKDRDHHKSRSSSRKERSLSKSSGRRDKRSDVLTFDKIRDERERQRARERERAMREEEKRRREIQRAREIEKRQREEAMRLEREREKLRIERERLDRQRQEILRLERERQKLEREKLEQEKQELRRQQMRLEEARRPLKRPAPTSTSTFRRDAPPYTDDRKRVATERHYDETPPPPRFEVSAREPVPEVSVKKDVGKDYKSRMAYPKRAEDYSKRSEYKRDFSSSERHSSGGHTGHMVHSVNSGTGPSKFEAPAPYPGRERERERDIRDPNRREAMVPSVPPPRITKDSRSDDMRYSDRGGERSPVTYRPVRDERDRRPVSEHHAKPDIRSSRDHRYGEPSPSMKEGARYRESNSWHSGGPSASKPFSGMSSSANSSRESWSKSDNWRPMDSGSNERWVGNNSSRLMMSGSSGVGNSMYSGGNSSGMSGMGSSLSCPPPPGSGSYAMDRFDNYKSMNNSRKY